MTARARRASLRLLYDSKDISADLAPYLKSFSFTDSFEAADDLQITLADPMALWRNGWFPDKGATLKATLRVADWTDEGDAAELYCGQFFIDEIKLQSQNISAHVAIVLIVNAEHFPLNGFLHFF